MSRKKIFLTALLLGLLLGLGLQATAESEGLPRLPEGNHLFYAAGEGETLYLYTSEDRLFRWRADTQLLEAINPSAGSDKLKDTIVGICLLEGRVYGAMMDESRLQLLHEEEPGGQASISLPQGGTYMVRMRTQGPLVWMLRSLGSSDNYVLCRLNTKTGEFKRYQETRGLYQYVPLPDNQVLLFDVRYEQGRYITQLRMLNTRSERVKPLMTLEGAAASPAYDQQRGDVLYVLDSSLWRWSLQGQPERVTSVPVANEWDHNPGLAIDGKLAVPYRNGVYLVDPAAQKRGALHVVGDGTSEYWGRGYGTFLVNHPDIALSNTMTAANKENFGTGDLAQRIMTGDLAYDVMQFGTQEYDLNLLIDKGYCADMSDDPELMALVARMHPAIRQLVMRDGKLYALPLGGQYINVLNPQAGNLALAGLDQVALPGSLEGLIELIGDWDSLTRQGDEPVIPLENVERQLKEYAISSYIYRLLSRGEPLRFNDPAFVQLLQLVEGQRLSRYAPGRFAFEFGQLTMNPHAIALSVFEGEPPVQPAYLTLYIVNSKSDNQQLARLYIKTAMEALKDQHKAFLYEDWTESVERPYYSSWYAAWLQDELGLKSALDAAQTGSPEKHAAWEQLNRHLELLEDAQRWRYDASEEAIANYQQRIAPYLYFPMPGVFTDWSQPGAVLLQKEIDRYLKGQLSAQQLADSLDQMARLMELENR